MYIVEFKFSIYQRTIKKEKVYGESNWERMLKSCLNASRFLDLNHAMQMNGYDLPYVREIIIIYLMDHLTHKFLQC